MFRIALAALSLSALAGCVHAQQFSGPSGEKMVEIRCNGAINGMANCYDKAREECGGNFQVVDQRQGVAYLETSTPRGTDVTPVQKRSLVVACVAGGASAVATP